MSNILYRIRCIDNNMISHTTTDNYRPEYGKIYSVINEFKAMSPIYHIMRKYITLAEFPSFSSYTLDSFEIIDDNTINLGERAPQHSLFPSSGKDIVPVAAYKFNHIF